LGRIRNGKNRENNARLPARVNAKNHKECDDHSEQSERTMAQRLTPTPVLNQVPPAVSREFIVGAEHANAIPAGTREAKHATGRTKRIILAMTVELSVLLLPDGPCPDMPIAIARNPKMVPRVENVTHDPRAREVEGFMHS
jgi:hypothetical protein